jgi:hypothetical protein
MHACCNPNNHKKSDFPSCAGLDFYLKSNLPSENFLCHTKYKAKSESHATTPAHPFSHEERTVDMAFKFTWPTFSPSFYETASNLLTSALSKAPTPPIITDNIIVKEFNLGTTAPELEMLEIGELGDDRFRGVFKLKYAGDAYIVLQTKVQVCPLLSC